MALDVHDDRHWTYDDYCQLPQDGRRYEVIRGQLHVTPAPRTLHQLVVGRLYEAFLPVQRSGRCWTLLSPTDVRVADCDPVQPDLIVLRREQRKLIQEHSIQGAPALVIEVLSPSTRRHDRITKLNAYARAGIESYWLASPEDGTLELLRLNQGSYQVAAALGPGEVAEPSDWPGLRLVLDELFAPLPEE
ncbi:Uma2 family endonuclease [bacterium CPR1]|nr:Uma2 family endonuclease [bacterium CPR1]